MAAAHALFAALREIVTIGIPYNPLPCESRRRRSRRLRVEAAADRHASAARPQVDDRGTHSETPVDYPPICAEVARARGQAQADRGIVIGGSGQGEQMAANKVPGVRAALCNDLYTARLSRQHNDANVLAMGGRIVALRARRRDPRRSGSSTPFEGGRHQRRLDQIAAIERHAAQVNAVNAYDMTTVLRPRTDTPFTLAHAGRHRSGDRGRDCARASPAEQRPRAHRV